MATAPDFTGTHAWVAKGVLKSSWTATASGTGSVLDAAYLIDKTVHVAGPTGGSTLVHIEGSNFGASGPFVVLKDQNGVDMSATTAFTAYIAEGAAFIRPRVETATKTVDIVIYSRANLR